jgi:hypothetical protein
MFWQCLLYAAVGLSMIKLGAASATVTALTLTLKVIVASTVSAIIVLTGVVLLRDRRR